MMMKARSSLAALLLATATLAAPGMGYAQSVSDLGSRLTSDQAQDRVARGALRPLRDILSGLEDQFGGRYLRHRLFDGRPPVYEIDWLKGDGERVTVRVNAETGAILDVS